MTLKSDVQLFVNYALASARGILYTCSNMRPVVRFDDMTGKKASSGAGISEYAISAKIAKMIYVLRGGDCYRRYELLKGVFAYRGATFYIDFGGIRSLTATNRPFVGSFRMSVGLFPFLARSVAKVSVPSCVFSMKP